METGGQPSLCRDRLSSALDSSAVRTAAVVRILTGVLFLALAWEKATGGFVRGGFAEDARKMAQESWPFWKTFLEGTVVANAGVFAWVLVLGEIAVGAGLILGLLTRAACAGGIALMLVILLGSGKAEPGAAWHQWITAGLTAKFTLLLLVLLFAVEAGQRWGIDARLSRRRAGMK